MSAVKAYLDSSQITDKREREKAIQQLATAEIAVADAATAVTAAAVARDMKRDRELMNRAVHIRLEELPEVVNQVLGAGLTPIVIDRSIAHNADTFFGYGVQGLVEILSAKKMVVEKTKEKKPVPEILECARRQLVNCMKKGKILCLLCENSVPDFASTFNDHDGGCINQDPIDGERLSSSQNRPS